MLNTELKEAARRFKETGRQWEMSLCITRRCNLVCSHCSAGIGWLKEYPPDMTLDQVRDLVKRCQEFTAESGIEMRKAKVLGGEPTLHPDLVEIVTELLKVARKVWIVTNGVVPKRKLPEIPLGSRYKVDHYERKAHTPFLWSPADNGIELTKKQVWRNCHALKHCQGGETTGFTPCSSAVPLSLGLGFEWDKFVDVYPTIEPPMEICKHCVYALPRKKQIEIEQRTDLQIPSKSFEPHVKKFYKITCKADYHLRRPKDEGDSSDGNIDVTKPSGGD